MESMLIQLKVEPYHLLFMPLPERMIALVGEGDAIHAVFGPETDLNSRYVAQVCDSRRVLPGTHMEAVQGKDMAANAHVAILDDQGRPWAITGPAGDEESIRTAQAIASHPAFREAVTAAQDRNMVLARDAGRLPLRLAPASPMD